VPPGKGKLVSSEKIPGCIRPDLIGERGEVVDVPIETKLGQTLRGKDLLFQRGMVVNGRVLDPDGRPLAGAEFVGLVEQAPSRADGNFALSGLFPEESNHYLVLHRQKGLAAVTSLEPAADSNAVPLSIVLRPTRTASGSVVDENGQPVAASRVWLRVNIRFHETARGFSYASPMVRGPQVTDSAGKYTFSGPAEEGRYSLDVAAMGYATSQASFHIESAKDCTVPDIVLLRNDLTFDGSVVDQTGKPVEGVEVDIIPRNPRVASSGYQWMKTTKEGRFHFDHVTDGAYRLIATLWKPTGQKDERGHPINEAVARTELNVIAADKTARIVLQLP